jgi:hypothetical protein
MRFYFAAIRRASTSEMVRIHALADRLRSPKCQFVDKHRSADSCPLLTAANVKAACLENVTVRVRRSKAVKINGVYAKNCISLFRF